MIPIEHRFTTTMSLVCPERSAEKWFPISLNWSENFFKKLFNYLFKVEELC